MKVLNEKLAVMERNVVNDRIEADYNRHTAYIYRANDLRDISTPASREVVGHLRYLCQQFDQRINALDVGCGTGRFFHALEKVNELTGLDLSEQMLERAESPLYGKSLDVKNIKLIHSDFLSAKLPRNGYDLIYAIGVYGHPAPIDKTTIDRFYTLLAPGGRLFFTIANQDDDKFKCMLEKSRKRKLIEACIHLLPQRYQKRLLARWENFFISQVDMEKMLDDSLFTYFRTWPMVNRFIACEAIKL